MQGCKPYNLPRQLFRRFKSLTNFLGYPRPLRVVTDKIARILHAIRLAYIVQQRGKPYRGIRIRRASHRMLQNVVLVVFLILINALARIQLRQNNSHNARIRKNFQPVILPPAYAVLLVSAQQKHKLGKNSFRRNVAYQLRICTRPVQALLVWRKARLRGNSCKAHKPQPVLAEHFFCGCNRGYALVFDVLQPAQRVNEFSRRNVVIYRVALKIAPPRVKRYIVSQVCFRGPVTSAHIFVGAEASKLELLIPARKFYGARVFILGFKPEARIAGAYGKIAAVGGRAYVGIGRCRSKPRGKITRSSADNVQRVRQFLCKFYKLFGQNSSHYKIIIANF